MNRAMNTNSLMPITQRPDIVFSRGSGSWLFDQEGKRYLDWIQGWAVNCLGHAPTQISEAIARQAATLINPSPAFYNEPAIELADLLTHHSVFDHVFFASSGAEANEGAIKLARKWGQLHKHGAYEIITFINAFHGRTLATMSASGKPGWDTLFAPQVPGFPKANFNDIDSVRNLVNEKTVAIMLEPIQGEAGVIPASPVFQQALRTLCDEHDLLLIYDEVQTGCGRTGPLFAYEHAEIEPDIMTLGKGLGGGAPLSALLVRRDVSCFEAGDQGGTFCGNPLICAVGVAVMQTLLADGFLDSAQATARIFSEKLRGLSRDLGLGEVRGSGWLLALELGNDIAPQVVVQARTQGLLLNAPRPQCLRFMPALNMSLSEIDAGMDILRRVLEQFPASR
jgi:acetylornithine/N-succinyldiaminopimelate aminotransferase